MRCCIMEYDGAGRHAWQLCGVSRAAHLRQATVDRRLVECDEHDDERRVNGLRMKVSALLEGSPRVKDTYRDRYETAVRKHIFNLY